MASERRLEKLSQLVKEEISEILKRGLEFPEQNLVTVTRVEISPDARYGAVFISILGGNHTNVLEILSKNVYNIQQMLNRRLRIRPVPKIHFALDEDELKREGVEELLAKLKREREV
ncbi:MAG TPA: 30S ribosome-binding factor RbfA [Candidatus Paceibacterota bacterium]